MCSVWSHWTVKYWERSVTVWRYNIHYCNGSPLFLVTPNSVSIDHFNMLADSFTDYWSQGQTIHYVLVDIAQSPMGTLSLFNLYVALSRNSGQDIIQLLQDFNEWHFQRSHDVMSRNTQDCADSSHTVSRIYSTALPILLQHPVLQYFLLYIEQKLYGPLWVPLVLYSYLVMIS